MEKEKLKKYYTILESKYNKAIRYERNYKNGKNKTIRNSGLENLREEIEDLEYQTNNNQEFFNLITSPDSASHAKTIFWDEFLTVQYFTRDLKEILDKIRLDLSK